jgi:hypothetical protein
MTSRPIDADSGTTDSVRRTKAMDMDCEQHREDLLDEALNETFPASDPPSIARPAVKGC